MRSHSIEIRVLLDTTHSSDCPDCPCYVVEPQYLHTAYERWWTQIGEMTGVQKSKEAKSIKKKIETPHHAKQLLRRAEQPSGYARAHGSMLVWYTLSRSRLLTRVVAPSVACWALDCTAAWIKHRQTAEQHATACLALHSCARGPPRRSLSRIHLEAR